jgi:hypothetical protein
MTIDDICFNMFIYIPTENVLAFRYLSSSGENNRPGLCFSSICHFPIIAKLLRIGGSIALKESFVVYSLHVFFFVTTFHFFPFCNYLNVAVLNILLYGDLLASILYIHLCAHSVIATNGLCKFIYIRIVVVA